jgi:hypothetical protein
MQNDEQVNDLLDVPKSTLANYERTAVENVCIEHRAGWRIEVGVSQGMLIIVTTRDTQPQLRTFLNAQHTIFWIAGDVVVSPLVVLAVAKKSCDKWDWQEVPLERKDPYQSNQQGEAEH